MDFENLDKFFSAWLAAIKKGWTVVLIRDNFYVLGPPATHKAMNWAQESKTININGLTIMFPHFLYQLYQDGEL